MKTCEDIDRGFDSISITEKANGFQVEVIIENTVEYDSEFFVFESPESMLLWMKNYLEREKEE